MRPLRAVLLVSLLLCPTAMYSQEKLIYKDPGASVENRVSDLLGRMSLQEKLAMLGGVEGFFIRPNERLGIPKIRMADGPLGVRNFGRSTAFPAGIALAASWNVDLMRTMAEAVGDEARAKAVHIMLAPGVNIYRAPMCGRNFEYFGEDPYLASRMAVAYITGVQSKGVVATVKHYVANNQEYDRNNVSSDVDERTLREIYLPAFEAAVTEGGVGAVMNSYNPVNGIHTSQHRRLLTDILKDEWGFDGCVMSDWSSTYDGVAAAQAGLDLEMPYAALMSETTLQAALDDGTLSEDTIDDKVRRMLRVMFRFGFFDRAQYDPAIPRYNPDARLAALRSAREGIVLLKNQNGLLPLDTKTVKSIAVLGPNAHPAVTGGSGSSRMDPFRSVSLLEALIARGGDEVRVFYAPNTRVDAQVAIRSAQYGHQRDDGSLSWGLKAEYYPNMDLSGTPVLTRVDRRLDFQWGNGSPADELAADNFSARWTGEMLAQSKGPYDFLLRGDDGYRLWVDGEKVIDEWHDQGSTVKTAAMELDAGAHTLVIEYYEHGGDAELAFGWQQRDPALEGETVKIAATADAAIVCVGFSDESEGEGYDRPFALPSDQEELIRQVAAVNKRTVVVVMAGGHVMLGKGGTLVNEVAGLLHAWYPGQEGGTAVAEILFGDVNPSGKLPATFEKRWEDNPTFASYYDDDGDKRVEYSEGVFVGYRHYDAKNVEPMFPFGFGLSYTTFAYGDLKLSGSGTSRIVSFSVRNSGARAGSEVAQVYVQPQDPSVPRPVKELKGFSKVHLKPGESRTIDISLDQRSFSYYDTVSTSWVAENGTYDILVGSSSRDIRLRGSMELK